MKPANNYPTRPRKPVDLSLLQSVRLLDQVRERIRYPHYAIKTERVYCLWAKAFVRFHGLRHTRAMGRRKTGMRLPECLRLRVKNGDFERNNVVVRGAMA